MKRITAIVVVVIFGLGDGRTRHDIKDDEDIMSVMLETNEVR